MLKSLPTVLQTCVLIGSCSYVLVTVTQSKKKKLISIWTILAGCHVWIYGFMDGKHWLWCWAWILIPFLYVTVAFTLTPFGSTGQNTCSQILVLLSGWLPLLLLLLLLLLLWIQINPGFETTHFKHRLAFSTKLLRAECIFLNLSSNKFSAEGKKKKKSSCHNKMPTCHLSKGKWVWFKRMIYYQVLSCHYGKTTIYIALWHFNSSE